MPLSYRNQSIDLLCKSMDWFLYDNGLRYERVKRFCEFLQARNYNYGLIIGKSERIFSLLEKADEKVS